MNKFNFIAIVQSPTGHSGNCWICGTYFKKEDYFIILERAKINKIINRKLCPICYLTPLANKIGWKKIDEMVLKMIEEQI
jgi:hypothetical protein